MKKAAWKGGGKGEMGEGSHGGEVEVLFEEGDELVGGLFLVFTFDLDGDLGALAKLQGENLHDGGDVAGSVAVAQENAAGVVHEGLDDDCRGAAVDALGVLDGCGPGLHGYGGHLRGMQRSGEYPKVFSDGKQKKLESWGGAR